MKDIQDYLIQFVETKQEIFNNFPVCPFAKRERVENKIKFVEFFSDVFYSLIHMLTLSSR